MWTRAELKSRAKAGLKNYYWMAVLTGFVCGLLFGIAPAISGLLALIPIVGCFMFILGPVIGCAVSGLLSVGYSSYFIKSARNGRDAGMGELFSGFQGDRIKTIFGIAAVYALWHLVPIYGIIKHYELYMVYYLAADYPEKSRKEIYELSKRMMDGNKMSTFVLELSFIGWWLLATITCGIGILFLNPYISATMAELYLWLKDERLGMGGGYASPSGDNSGNGGIQLGQNGGNPVGMIETSAKKGYLTGIQGEFTGANIPIERGEILKIGRDAAQCNIVVKGAQMSRLHLIVEFDGSAFRATDMSSGGTFNLQGGQLPKGQAVTLPSGTYLQIGTGGDIFMLECK